MSEHIPDGLLSARICALLEHAVAALDEQDRAERVAYCQQHDQHGVRVHLDDGDDLIEFSWGGRRLAMIPREALLDDAPLPQPQFIADTPDTIPDEWSEQ